MNETAKLRKHIVSTFSLNSFTIQEKACAHLVQQLGPIQCNEDRDQWLEKIIDYVRVSCTNDGNIVTYELLTKALKFCCDLQILNDADILRVIDACNMPHYRYCPTTKKFLRVAPDIKFSSMFGDAPSKIAQYVDRYTIIKQRMTRIKTLTDGKFNQPLTIGDKIRDIDFLLSSGAGGKFDGSSKNGPILLLGMLVQLKEGGRYYLEDPTGAIPLDLSSTEFQKGYFSENCCVLAEGRYSNDRGVFAVTDMALPPCERAEISRIYFGGSNTFDDDDHSLKSCNPRLLEYEKSKQRMIIFICDVFLDDPKVLKKFRTFLNAFNDVVPVAIVMMGDFLSCHVPSHIYAQELKSRLTQLGHYLNNSTPELCKHTTFVLMPGPGDRYCGSAGASILPRPSIPECLTEEFRNLVPRCVFTTNPCRMQYCTQQIHIIRSDGLMKKTANYDVRYRSMDQKNCSSVTETNDNSDVKNYIKTLESQSHLITVPLDVCPTYWPLASNSLSLYPMPDLVCVADANAPEYSTKDLRNSDTSSTNIMSSSGCVFINPSSFAKNKFRFSVYLTALREVDDSQIPDDDDGDLNNTLDT